MNEGIRALCIQGVGDMRGGICYQAAVMTGKADKGGTAGERIAKAIARAGLASRREAEAWIAAGRVTVNGEKIASPAINVTPADRVTVDGQPLPVRERTRLFLFHKPRGLVTTHADPQGRPTVFSVLPKHLPRLISIGRLDANTEGLLLLTNDGGLARTLELPATGWTRRYRVRANGKVTQLRLDRLRHGIEIDGVTYGPIEARLDREQGANVWLTFAMREGKNREVKNVLGHLGLAVNRLIRVSFGPFQLGDLPEGAVDEVRTRHLREQLGERVATAAGLDFAAPIADQERQSAVRAPASPRHPEAAGEAGPRRMHGPGRRPSRLAALAPQGDEAREARGARSKQKPRRHGPDRMGEPERARQERKRGRKPFRGKPR
jgi:23S rRNA pseudouridine2605 synthase